MSHEPRRRALPRSSVPWCCALLAHGAWSAAPCQPAPGRRGRSPCRRASNRRSAAIRRRCRPAPRADPDRHARRRADADAQRRRSAAGRADRRHRAAVAGAPVSGEAALAHRPATRRAGTQAVLHRGPERRDRRAGSRRPPTQRYGELQAGVQLANRSGALNEIEYSEFVQKVQAFAEGVGAHARLPRHARCGGACARTRRLRRPAGCAADGEAAGAVGGLVGGLRAAVAARHGLVPGAVPGRLVLPPPRTARRRCWCWPSTRRPRWPSDPQAAALREVTLSLDVPQTPAAGALSGLAPRRPRAGRGHGRRPRSTTPASRSRCMPSTPIGQELPQLYAALETLDLAAGSPAARRLFSG